MLCVKRLKFIRGEKRMDMNQYEKYRKLGLNIAYYRKDRKYTQLVLAEHLDIDRTHIQKIETAVAAPSLDLMFLMSDVLKVPVHKFFEFRD